MIAEIDDEEKIRNARIKHNSKEWAACQNGPPGNPPNLVCVDCGNAEDSCECKEEFIDENEEF